MACSTSLTPTKSPVLESEQNIFWEVGESFRSWKLSRVEEFASI